MLNLPKTLAGAAKAVGGTLLKPLTGDPEAERRAAAATKAAATRRREAAKRSAAGRQAAQTRKARADERSSAAKRGARKRTQRKARVDAMVDATRTD